MNSSLSDGTLLNIGNKIGSAYVNSLTGNGASNPPGGGGSGGGGQDVSWTPIGAVTLNPEREAVITAHLPGSDKKRLAA